MTRTPVRTCVPSATDDPLAADGASLYDLVRRLSCLRLAPGTVYIVSLPIGHPDDISIRALRVLKAVSVIAAENPPLTRALLHRYGIQTSVTGYRTHEGSLPIAGLLSRLRAGETVALVCDTGTPVVDDAGGSITRAALNAGLALCAVPGPVAAMAALVVAGCEDKSFAFDGFPPRHRTDRHTYFASLTAEMRNILIYESRRLLHDTLMCLRDSLGAERATLVARDLTKASQTLYYGALGEAVSQFCDPPVGEYTIVVSSRRRSNIQTRQDGD